MFVGDPFAQYWCIDFGLLNYSYRIVLPELCGNVGRESLFTDLVGKCSATRYSVAAPPLGARHGLEGPMHPRHPPAVAEREVRQGPLGGQATHSELRNEPRQGCSYTVERDRGGVTSAPLSSQMQILP